MKKTATVFLVLFLYVFMSACEKDDSEAAIDLEEYDSLEELIETVNLPDNFLIDVDLSKVTDKNRAKIYTATKMKFDEEQAIDELLQEEIVDTHQYAEGPQFETENGSLKEYLTVYDGGKSLGIDSGVEGGIGYSLYIDGESFYNNLSTVISASPEPPDNIGQMHGYNLKEDYKSFADLSFMNYNDVLSEVETVLSNVGFPSLTLAETYSLDLETMLDHYDLYLDSRSYYRNEGEEGEDDHIQWSEDDETYIFLFQQELDGIPLSNRFIRGTMSTYADVYYTKHGIRHITAYNFIDVLEESEEKSLISGTDAIQKVIDSYSEIILKNETKIISMELLYVSMVLENGDYELIPAWVFGIAESSDWSDEFDGGTYSLDSYEYFVVDAITGEKIEWEIDGP